MNDVVAVLSDPYFFTSDAQHELTKRNLKTSGPKETLLQRLFEALEAEFAEGWTLGYLLNTKILPFNHHHHQGRDPRNLIGHHIQSYECDDENGIIKLELSDGEDVTIVSSTNVDKNDNDNLIHNYDHTSARIKMDHDLFWSLHTLDGMKAIPRHLAKEKNPQPLLITGAATGMRRDRWGKDAGYVLGLRFQHMTALSFFFLAATAGIKAHCLGEDLICGHVWVAKGEADILREDVRMLHGC